jgi:hydroxyethylthiazole kinase
MKDQLWGNILAVRKNAPLVHSIANYVVMNTTANALLAVGASPIMAHAHAEMKDMVSIANALVINIGTLDEYWVESMNLAISAAEAAKKPWILDPVGAGATTYRDQVLKSMITKFRPAVIRGNASEIIALAGVHAATKGVDSIHRSDEALGAATHLTHQLGSIICVSGAIDMIVHHRNLVSLKNGHVMMTRVTGLGCTASALVAAFCAVIKDAFEATVTAMALMGIAGEMAASRSAGPGSLQMHFLDILQSITEKEFCDRLKLEANVIPVI